MIIYCITNKINGKQYVGQTVRTVEERFKEHARHSRTIIERAIQKYGKENFDVEVIDSSLIIDDLNEKEKYWIKELNTKHPGGYNLCDGGENTFGYKHRMDSRLKMSFVKRMKNSAVGEKNHFYGQKHTEETRKKMSEAWTSGKRVMTEEQKKKMKEAHSTRKVLNVTTGERFDSIKEASEKYNIKGTHISRVCRSKRGKTGGFEWKYIDGKTS